MSKVSAVLPSASSHCVPSAFQPLMTSASSPLADCYPLDFALDPEGAKLDLEIDGVRWHTDQDGNRKIADTLRDRELIARGWRVRRFWVHELSADLEKCIDLVESDLRRD